MAVGTTGVSVSYLGNAVLLNFGYPNYLWEPSDLVVTVNGVPYFVNGLGANGFTLSGTPDNFGSYPSGAMVLFNVAPALGAVVFITRLTPRTQLSSFITNSDNIETQLEHGLDKLTLIAQEASLILGYSAIKPTSAGALGNIFWNQNPAAGTNIGWVCTTAGGAGVAVWNSFGQISLS